MIESIHALAPSIKQITIFDTNVYRRRAMGADPAEARRRFELLRHKESAKGIQAMAHPYVLLELLARLAEPADAHYSTVKAAIIGMYEHAAISDGKERHLAIVPDPDTQICYSLYGRYPDGADETLAILAAIPAEIYSDPSESNLDRMRPDLAGFARIVREREQRFVEDMKIHLGQDPAAPWRPFSGDKKVRRDLIAYLDSAEAETSVLEALVIRAQRQLGTAEDPAETREKADAMRPHFKVGVSIYNSWIRTAVRDGVDPAIPKHANTLWDLHICFAVGPDSTIQGRPIRLVTDERKLRTAAEIFDPNPVMTDSGYRASLEPG